MPSFRHRDQRLHFETYGEGDRVIVLVHGLLLNMRMQQPLAHELARRGNRVVLLDLLGHGRSDRPRDMWHYSMTAFGEQVVGLLDHLEVEQAVVGGTSLGANTALEVAHVAPQRLRGMVIEMPVLDNALLACAVAFTPLLVGLTFGESWMRALSRAARAIPRRMLPFWGDVLLDVVRQDPAPSAAVLQGVFFGRVAPHRDLRRTFQAPALVIGHHRDPLHPFSDSGMLADELPNGRLLKADSVVELRVNPRRLTGEIAAFVEGCWSPVHATRERAQACR